MTDDSLSSHVHEMDFAPDPAFAAQANGTADLYDRAGRGPRGLLGRAGAQPHHVDHRLRAHARLGRRPVRQVVRRRPSSTSPTTASTATSRPATATASRSTSRARPGDTRTITYADLQREVAKAANALTELGVGTGDTVAIYMPMIPETVFTMLACARLGAPHSVIFGGFSAEALHTRIDDAQCKVVVTTDGQFRRGKPAPLKPAVDEALTRESPVEKVLVVQAHRHRGRLGRGPRRVVARRSSSGQPDTHEAQPHDSEHPLFILYTSGTTGKPKGIFHTSGGYLTQVAYTNAVVHDVHPETDVYWCTADVGWVTGHSYIVYGPLANGATQVMYEGTPDTPHQGRWWELIEKYKVSILYTAPTAIRTFMKWGDDIPAKFDLSSRARCSAASASRSTPRRGSGTASTSAAARAPIVDTWWQTETGAHHDQPAARASRPSSPARRSARSPASPPRSSTTRASRSPSPRRSATSCSPSRGRRCCAASGATPSATRRPTGRRFGAEVLLRRRRREVRREGQHLAARPGRRRHERLGPPALDGRDRVGARLAPVGRRGRGRRAPATRRPARRSARSSSCAATRPTRARRRSRSCATTWPRRSARSPSRGRS